MKEINAPLRGSGRTYQMVKATRDYADKNPDKIVHVMSPGMNQVSFMKSVFGKDIPDNIRFTVVTSDFDWRDCSRRGDSSRIEYVFDHYFLENKINLMAWDNYKLRADNEACRLKIARLEEKVRKLEEKD